MLDLIASLAILAVNRVLHFLPMEFTLWVGRSFGGVVYLMSGKRKMVTYANLRAAFCHEKTPEELRALTKGSYTQVAQTFAELIAMTKVNDEYIDKYITIRNIDRALIAAKNPKGMLFVSAHFGNWEISSAVSAAKGVPLYILARDQKMKRVNDLFNWLRESKGSVVVRKGADVKRLIRMLREGRSVGLLADQNAGVNGKLLELFGRLASTAVGPYRLAQKGAVILPAFIHRKKGPYHELILEEVISIEKDEDIVPYMEKYNRLLEKHVREDPEQWFWMHKKWKMNPVRKIIVLDDGKKGHLNQSMGIIREIIEYRESEGRDPENIKVKVIKVNFFSDRRKAAFKIIAPVFGRNCQGKLGLLRWALDRRSYEEMATNFADIIVSTGSSLACVNMMLKDENYGRNIAVLDPGALIRRKFNLIVIPRHDRRKELDEKAKAESNIVVTELAPNMISAKEMRGDVASSSDKKLNVGVLIGGDNKHFIFTEKLIKEVLFSAVEFCNKHEGVLHVTTSRRTPELVEKSAEDILSGSSVCKTFVRGSSDKDPGTVARIMKECDVLIVSLESISMVSESVSSGKRVLVFMPEKTSGKDTKYERFTRRLASLGYLALAESGEITKIAEDLLGRVEPAKEVEDGKHIREKLYRLF